MDFGSKYAWAAQSDEEDKSSSEEEFGESELRYSDCEDDYKRYSDSDEDGETAMPDAPQQQQQQQRQQQPQQQRSSLLGRVGSLFGRRRSRSRSRSPTRNESTAADAPAPPPAPSVSSKAKPSSKVRRVRKADTNILSLNLGTLAQDTDLATGDATECTHCTAVLSSFSKLVALDDDNDGTTHRWACEFCGTENNLILDEMEIPKEAQLDYIIDSAAGFGADENAAASSKAAAKGGDDRATMRSSTGVAAPGEELVVFCIDVSGSMCVTTEVSGTQVLKGHERIREAQADLRGFIEGEDQFRQGQRRDTTWISRLQCVQAAVDAQLATMAAEHPARRCGLVSFSNDVVCHGDGSSSTPAVITGDLLSNFDGLVAKGRELGKTMLDKPIKDTREKLSGALFALRESGATALGPALLTSIAMIAGSGKASGSRVVICTDGLANIGLGDLESEEKAQEAEDFYSQLGDLAATMGISVSVVSIKGSDCKMEHLGSVADVTSGNVNIVDPMLLTQEFASILADEVVATGVVVTVKLPDGLFIRDEQSALRQQSQQATTGPGVSRFVQTIGNVTKETVVTYEYGVAPGVHMSELMKRRAATGDNNLPFQIRIEYTATRDRSRRMRVITRTQEVTRDRDQAEREANVEVLGTAVAQQTAKFAMRGDYSAARTNAFTNKLLMKRCAEVQGQQTTEVYSRAKQQLVNLDLELRSATRTERREYGRSCSDDESDDESNEEASERRQRVSQQKSKSRKGARKDGLATALYQAKKGNMMSKKS